MEFPDEAQGDHSPSVEPAHPASPHEGAGEPVSYSEGWSSNEALTSPEPLSSEPASPEPVSVTGTVETNAPITPSPAPSGSGRPPRPPKPPDPPDEDPPDEEDGMAKMSFLDHLEELRRRLILSIGGVGVAFFLSLIFSNELWLFVSAPAVDALTRIGVKPPELAQISPMDVFQIVWMKLPILSAIFLSSPWILYQVWAFIAPGLYKKERRYAAPFVISSAGLFILGGMFAYYVAFRYGLAFLLGIGLDLHIRPFISVTEYYDLFVDVMLGVGIVFEIPVLLFLLTLLRVASPSFLVRHSRYAILVIVFLAAVITPTGDVFNLALFATPMIILFYIGIFASYILVLRREKRSFPWRIFIRWTSWIVVILAAIAWLVAKYYGYHFVTHWPLFVR